MSGCGWTSGRRKRSEEAVEQATKEALVVREWSLDTLAGKRYPLEQRDGPSPKGPQKAKHG
ncbi:hypothetical protein BDFG_07803 [Blastomyces dermatitidis ATCC 26199]|nr:hypothetical protein BDFG_07803 [Blastomyces dermatitidis ATCC 26199]